MKKNNISILQTWKINGKKFNDLISDAFKYFINDGDIKETYVDLIFFQNCHEENIYRKKMLYYVLLWLMAKNE